MRSETEPKVVVWNIFGMVDSLDSARYERNGQIEEAKKHYPIKVRANIKEALETLRDSGYSVYLMSEAYLDEAEPVLKLAGLDGLGTFVDKHVHRDESATTYPYLTKSLGLSPEQAKRRMIAVSCWRSDLPRENPGMVFIKENERGMDRVGLLAEDALVTASMIQTLDEAGNGDFSAGFSKIYQNGRQVENPEYPTWRINRLLDQTEFNMDYASERDYVWESECNNMREQEVIVPTIWWIRSETLDLTPRLVSPTFSK